ncbi:MAG: glycosyltransferase, partial [Clostridiales bacterium]|nr:glycosyltransferase [Clostridiales bacterium]
FIGSRPHVEIPDWLNASDLLCLPSLDEGHPNIVLEALACGIPVVASRVGGIPEIIKSAEEGLLVAPKDSLSISNAILNIIENKGCFGRRSNKTVRTWKDVANEMHDEFGKVIGNKIVKENC